MRPYVGFDLFEQRMRDSLTGLIAAVPRTTKLAYFNTQSVCDAKLAPPALRERALACKMAQEEGCFGCPAGVEFTPGVPAACKSVVESEMQVHHIMDSPSPSPYPNPNLHPNSHPNPNPNPNTNPNPNPPTPQP